MTRCQINRLGVVLDPKDFEVFHNSMLGEYRQALADAQLALATANAQNKVKDRIIAELRAELEPEPATTD